MLGINFEFEDINFRNVFNVYYQYVYLYVYIVIFKINYLI